MSHHDHIAHMINTTEVQSMPNMHGMGHSSHANTNHHMDDSSINPEYNAQGIIGSTGLCSSTSHAMHGMSVSYSYSIIFKKNYCKSYVKKIIILFIFIIIL
jgi:hypothetical protein